MRALMKGNALEYFRKKDKPLENAQAKMNQLEAKGIAKQIGIDSEQISAFQDFFEQVGKIKLPEGYQRCINIENNKIVYYNAETGLEQSSHPNIDIIKVTFYQIISDSASIASFNTKSIKLLTFVQEKMIKQCIGLSSKRRDAEKTNMQRDQNGKIVVSKLTRIKPDLRALISSRSYMIKALVEKVYTKKQIWGKGKKAAVYASIISAEKGNKIVKNSLEEEYAQTQESLQTYYKIFFTSKQFYDKEFGKIEDFPEILTTTKQYYKSTPQSVLRNVNILNIDKSNIEIFWLARVMQCLPLPPGWIGKPGDTFTRYFYEPLKLLFDIHPSLIYICELINEFKLRFRDMDSMVQNYYSNMKEMIFFDFFERSYKVDLFAYLQKVDELPLTKKKLFKKSSELGKNDWMALEGFKNSQLSATNLIILEDILEYWEQINWKQDNYSPAISPYGQIIWSSNINQRTIDFCPHQALLKNLVSKKELDLPEIRKQDLKEFLSKDGFFQKISTEREQFLKHFIRNDPKPLSTAYQIQKIYEQGDYFDSVFISSFNLEGDLHLDEGEVPLWLQKVHAKKNTQLFNSMICFEQGMDLNELKQQFGDYAVKMIEDHEPNRTEDIKKVISQIKTKKQLKKFIQHINDIDSREERKRLLMGDVFDDDQESFGSSISQIKMEEFEKSSLSSQDQLIEIEDQNNSSLEKVQSDKESLKSIASSRKSSNQNIISEVEEQKEQDQRPEKYQSQIYLRDHKIQSLDSHQLSQKLELLKNDKILKHKYSRANIKQTIGKITKQSMNPDMIEEYKRNLLISRFNSEHSPYRISPTKIKHNNIMISTGINMLDMSQSFSPFRSEASILGNEEMSEELKRYKSINLKQENENLKLEDTKINAADETHQTIQLMPLKRIKPDIREDPCLTHISAFKGVDIFRKTFNSDFKKETKLVKQNEQKQKKITERTSASLGKSTTDISLLSSKSQRSFSNIKIKQRLLQTSREKYGQTMFSHKLNTETPKMGKSHSVLGINSTMSPNNPKFGRVCLADTASGLLQHNPIKKKGDVIRMEAQKSLLSKGRGLNTLLAKMY